MSAGPQDRKPGFSTRTLVLVSAAIALLLLAAAWVGAFLVPFLQTRAVVRACAVARPREDDSFRSRSLEAWIERLGGASRAAKRLGPYLEMPRWTAPHKPEAVRLLGRCGEPAMPALVEALGRGEVEVRRAAVQVLEGLGSEAEGAVPALEEALKDEDRGVREAAAQALLRIRGWYRWPREWGGRRR